MDDVSELIERLHGHQMQEVELSPQALAKRDLAASIRGLCHVISRSDASAEQMREMADQLDAHRDVLAVTRAASTPPVEGSLAMVPGMEDFRDRGPIAGQANPLAPPATLAPDLEAGIVIGEVTFGPAFEGAPGCVHGGFVAAVLDEALGMACIFNGGPAMTAELTTRYVRPTPITAQLRVEARLVSAEGRKIRTSGEVYHGEQLVAEGDGLFIAVDGEKFLRLAAARAERAALPS